jgi:pyrimidine operon attenuation protein / uracil phosphoribosyltransferase
MDNFILQKKILTPEQTDQKVRRVAYEIYERNFEESELVLAGIIGQGYELATLLSLELKQIASIKIHLMEIDVNKSAPYQQPVSFDLAKAVLTDKVIVVIDDVLHTGRTLAYSLSPFLGIQVKKLQVAVMVNRGHRLFPISADYVGYALSTTLNEHIKVVLAGKDAGVYLS